MVEIEHIQDIEKDQPAKSSAKEQKLKDPKDLTTETQDTDASEATEHDEQIENQKVTMILVLEDYLQQKYMILNIVIPKVQII